MLLASYIYRKDEGIACKIRLSAIKDDGFLDVSILSRNLDKIQRNWGKTALAICVSITRSPLIDTLKPLLRIICRFTDFNRFNTKISVINN